MIAVVFFQSTLSILACDLFVIWSEKLHNSGNALFAAQLCLRKENDKTWNLIRSKLKLMFYYELVQTRAKFCFKIGPLGKISKRSLFEVGIYYFYQN